MKWVYPEFLYALVLVAIPILIRLFNFRRFKKVQFTNVRFLREVKQETQSRSRLKHLLVLLMRMLAVAFLVFLGTGTVDMQKLFPPAILRITSLFAKKFYSDPR